MQKFTFIADGKTKIFYFTFPFFLKSDVIIEVDSQPATNYNLICTRNGVNADIPFSGGQVNFNKPPKAASVITIKRTLPVQRIVDYQPTAQYDARAHNQDMNYVLEILKDMQVAVESITLAPSEATNAEAITTISQQIAEIISTIDEMRSDSGQSGETVDLSEINSNIASLTTAIATLNTRCDNLDNQITNIPTPTLPDDTDYVVALQMPTAGNNYTWYRKYASGWVEQGGLATTNSGAATPVTLPITMATSSYMPFTQGCTTTDGYSGAAWHIMPVNTNKSKQTTSKFYAQGSITGYNLGFVWLVQGMAAQ